MSTNEIKKELYKQRPLAQFQYIRQGIAYYVTRIRGYDKVIPYDKQIYFEIPISDMGNADFFPEMDAKHLNRWIIPEVITEAG